jgi:uncharacterized membrane protein
VWACRLRGDVARLTEERDGMEMQLKGQEIAADTLREKLAKEKRDHEATNKRLQVRWWCAAALCCAVLRCAVLCCAVLCCAVLCCAVLCCAVLCCAVLCCAVLCCAVLCCAVLCCAALP